MRAGSGGTTRSSASGAGLVCALLLAACAGSLPPPPAERLHPTGNDDRLEALRPGLRVEEVRRHMGEEPIPSPLDGARPFANPHLELVFLAPDERRIEIWLYLTELSTHPECPFLTWSDRPAVFEDGRLVSWSWGGLRSRLEDYGRSADWYRQVRYPRFGRCGER